MQSVEASMRLDAVASAGMGLSRGKVKDMIEGGDVLVNWKEVRVRGSWLDWMLSFGPSILRIPFRLIPLTTQSKHTTQVTSANAQLKEGDIVTIRGKGRLEINAVEKTAKEKFRVKMTKLA
jgi:RNA-binding protein YlmH